MGDSNICYISAVVTSYLQLNHHPAAYCMHPGVVYTEIGRNLDSWTNNSVTRAMGRAMFWSPLQGAQSTIYCCVEESIKVC